MIYVKAPEDNFSVPDAQLPHAPARKRTQPAPPYNGNRQRHLSSSSSSTATSSSPSSSNPSSREHSAERRLEEIGRLTELQQAVNSLTSYQEATGLEEPNLEEVYVVDNNERERKEREERERKEIEERERREKEKEKQEKEKKERRGRKMKKWREKKNK